ncbi:MAG TPA: hypothetical protein VN581_14830 [Patescibacteria group bacterium]|nr:hypothetical protein [Patescibacteria group bacterium]
MSTTATATTMQLYLIYTDTQMLVSRHPYASWQDIQAQLADYKASLGPWEVADVIEYLADQYDDLEPAAEVQIAALLAASEDTRVVQFAARRG